MMRVRSLLAIGASFVLLAAATVTITLLLHARHASGRDRVEAHVGSVTLLYPPSYARFEPGRAGGMLDRLEIAFTFPDLRGAGGTASALPSDDDVAPDSAQLVFLTLRPPEEGADPADRMETLYARFLQSDVWQDDNGLVMRRFETGSPYEREELHFVPPEGRVFAARCMRPMQPPSDLPSTCLASIRAEGLDLDIRFSPTLLSKWDGLTEGVRRLVASFVVRGG